MLDTRARKAVDPLFERIAALLLRHRFTPNLVTALAFVLGLCAGVLLYLQLSLAAVLVLWLSGLLDAVDGTMARLSGKSSLFGTVLDVTADRVVELCFVWALALRHPAQLLPLLGLVSCILLSMTVFLTTGMLAQNNTQKSFYYPAGLMERTEGFVLFSLMALFQAYLSPITWVFAGLILFTAVQRLRIAFRLLQAKKNEI
ncbi:MAG TPA: CDP-alcohol phosphatidyltransferase family protein [Clostridia bacterium]|nr:CDP-alcohol phosphatidyltransferase family protein [Clostridia bacterium]